MFRNILVNILILLLFAGPTVLAQGDFAELEKARQVKALMEKEVEDPSMIQDGAISFYFKSDSIIVDCDARISKGEQASPCLELEKVSKDIKFNSRRTFKYSGWYEGEMGYHLNFPNKLPEGKTEVKKGWIHYPIVKNRRIQEKFVRDGQDGDVTYSHSESTSDKILYLFKEKNNMLTPAKWDRKYDREIKTTGVYTSYYKDGKKRARNQYEIMKYTHLSNNSVKESVDSEVEVTIFGTYTKWYESGRKYYTIAYDETHMKNYIINEERHENEVMGEGKLSGIYTAWHENGQIMCEGKLKNGKQTGVWKYFDFNGVLSEEMKYKGGKLTGDYVAYYDSGMKRRKIPYFNNWRTGLGFVYYQDGSIKEKTEYVKDQKFGLYQKYDRSGNLMINGFFQEDLKTDKWELFYASGIPRELKFYKENLLEGLRTVFFPNGAKASEVNFTMNREKGLFTEWFKNGVKKLSGKFHDGIKNGSWYKFFKSGEKEEMINYAVIKNPKDSVLSSWYENSTYHYEKHLRNGMWKKYYKNGQKRFEGNFTNGKLDGQQLYFDTNGVVVKKEIFVAGERKGDVQKYYSDGRIKMKGNYSDEVSLAIEAYFNEKGVQTIINGKGKITTVTKGFKEEVNYEFGAPHGQWKSWTSDGRIFEVGTYLRGEETGSYTQYNVDGSTKEEGYYFNGLEDGYWKSFDKKGRIMEEGTYREGEKVGKWKYYYSGGRPKEVIDYQENGQELVWDFWTKEGKRKVKEGKGEYYTRDHTGVMIKGMIINGLKEGQWNLKTPSKDVDYIVLFKKGKKIN